MTVLGYLVLALAVLLVGCALERVSPTGSALDRFLTFIFPTPTDDQEQK